MLILTIMQVKSSIDTESRDDYGHVHVVRIAILNATDDGHSELVTATLDAEHRVRVTEIVDSVSSSGKFPNLIRRYREERGLSQKQLAEVVGAFPSQISRWEAGVHRPYWRFALAIARALGTSVTDLHISIHGSETRPEAAEVPMALPVAQG